MDHVRGFIRDPSNWISCALFPFFPFPLNYHQSILCVLD